MANDNKKYVARVPIVPDDFANTNNHVNHELVMDFLKDDLYVKYGNAYSNITGKIKEDVKEIQDGSSIIHVVTEQTLPPVKERSENNWYYVITKAEVNGSGDISTSGYIYYGLIKTYDSSKNYLLIAQNMTTGNDVIAISILEGYCPCFYVPVNCSASFKNHDTGELINATIEDRVYALNSSIGNYVAYDVYTLELFEAGDYNIELDLAGSNDFIITFDSNESPIDLVLPENIHVADGYCIGQIDDPTWNDARYEFKGWSTSKISMNIINPESYKPNENMTLFAWFEYNSDPDLLEAYAVCVSSTSNEEI